MDRKNKLLALINGKFNGNQADFARAIGKSPSQINQWLAGVRNLGDGSVRLIEKKLKLGDYFDLPVNGITTDYPSDPQQQKPQTDQSELQARPTTIADLLAGLKDEIDAQPESMKKMVAGMVAEYLINPDQDNGQRIAEAIENIVKK